jgi:hypothetical protein
VNGADLLGLLAVVILAYVVFDYLQQRDRWAEDEYQRRCEERDDEEGPQSIRELVDRGKR